ncbi:hypothetical protein [Comamonas odontotermitis]|uniref:hypothetical protein n=1 Tax=Comamonas odontotermitis TaxID=379895 RepID=UPI0037516F6E
MKEFKLSKERIARVWVNEWPISKKDSPKITSNHFIEAECRGSLICIHNTIVVELLVPLGGKFSYGMLGVTTLGEKSFNPKIELCDSLDLMNDDVSSALANSIDTIESYIGNEYRDSILIGARDSAQEYLDLPEIIRFFGGRQGAFGSSQSLFKKLAFICLRLLSSPKENMKEELEKTL